VVTSPRPRPTNNFQILTNKNFWISENYQLAIFYFVDTSCFIGAQPLALMTANGCIADKKIMKKYCASEPSRIDNKPLNCLVVMAIVLCEWVFATSKSRGRRIGQVDVKSPVWPQI